MLVRRCKGVSCIFRVTSSHSGGRIDTRQGKKFIFFPRLLDLLNFLLSFKLVQLVYNLLAFFSISTSDFTTGPIFFEDQRVVIVKLNYLLNQPLLQTWVDDGVVLV